MGRIPTLKYRELAAILRRGGAVFLPESGNTNHHTWVFAVGGVPRLYVIPAHKPGADVKRVYIRELRRTWLLTEDDGVSDDDFMRGRWRREGG